MASLSAGVHYDTSKAVDFGRLPLTYASALHLLSLLPTNRDVTALFEIPKPEDGDGAPVDFNALAIPEVVAWMARAGYKDLPRDLAPLRCIHIAGTKGKGSVSAFATAMLVEAAKTDKTAAGVGRVGTYLSPHVVSVRERIWLDGRPIGRDLFAKYVFELWARLSEAAAAADPTDANPYDAHTKPFYFRFLTLLAFHVFLQEGVRSAVVECGIGGEYDATNVLPASSVTAAVVTRLGIDHVAMLGRTLPEIAWHKAGVFKEGVAAFTLQQSGREEALDGKDGKDTPLGESAHDRLAALAVLRTRAAEKKALALYEIPHEAVARWGGVAGASLPGAFQKYNMALAAAAARHHIQAVSGQRSLESAVSLDPSSIPDNLTAALARATLRGRCETVVDGASKYLIDGAHTADSLGEVGRYFAAQQVTTAVLSRRILLFSVRDRNPGDLVRAVVAGASQAGKSLFDHALFVFPPEAKKEREDVLLAMSTISPATASQVCDNVPAAIRQIRELAGLAGDGSGAQVLATGSFVLVREILQELDADFEE